MPSTFSCTTRMVELAATPGVARSFSTRPGTKGEYPRRAMSEGGETNTSAWSEDSSQLTTVPRKLVTMSPTPTVVATATISAASATAVRLRLALTPRAAMRPSTPNTAPRGLAAASASRSVVHGTSSAVPSRTAKSPE